MGMIDYIDAQSTDEKTLRRLWEWAMRNDVSGPRIMQTPPKTKDEIITQLIWVGVIGGLRGGGWR
jgi:hypothetical protein